MRWALILLFCGAGITHAEDWPQWRGVRGDGTWRAPALPAQWPEAGLKKSWDIPIGGGYGGIAVAADRVFVMDLQPPVEVARPKSDDPDGIERILCLNPNDGSMIWSHQYPVKYGNLGGYANGPRAMPTVAGKHVYTLGAVGHLNCFDVATGKLIWHKDTVRECKARIPDWGFAAAPVVDGERLLVHLGAEANGCLIACDRLTGRELWRSLNDPSGYTPPVLFDRPTGRQIVMWTPTHIRGLDARKGQLLWSVPYEITYGVSIATPIIVDDIVFVTAYWKGSKAIRLGPKATDHELLWESPRELCGLMAQPLHRDGYLYSIDKDHGLTCVELKTGKKLWDDDNAMTPRGRNPHASFVWLNDTSRILSLNAKGELILAELNPKGYHEQSRTKLFDGEVWSHPAFAGRHLYVRTDGAERWRGSGPHRLRCFELVP